MTPLYIAAVFWCLPLNDSQVDRPAIAGAILLVISALVGYLLVVAYVRQILKARPGFVRFVLVRDPRTR